MTETNGKAGCPICRKPMVTAHRPFCSRRCKDLDLHRWLGGHYRVKTEERQDPGEGEGGDPDEG